MALFNTSYYYTSKNPSLVIKCYLLLQFTLLFVVTQVMYIYRTSVESFIHSLLFWVIFLVNYFYLAFSKKSLFNFQTQFRLIFFYILPLITCIIILLCHTSFSLTFFLRWYCAVGIFMIKYISDILHVTNFFPSPVDRSLAGWELQCLQCFI